MATFNGFEIITLPTSPGAPRTVEWSTPNIVGVAASPFTGQQQIQNWNAGWLEASLSYPPMAHATFQAWAAFLLQLRGSGNIFQFGDPLGAAPRGSAAGTPLVKGANQTGYSLAMDGFTSSAAGVLLPGDWIQVGYRLYRNLTTVNADGSGNATATIFPALRESPADNASIVTTNAKGVWRMKNNTPHWTVDANRHYSLTFEIREAI